jgi:hypothetical protein
MATLKEIVSALEKKKVPCTVDIMEDGEVVFKLGFDYPNRISNKVFGIIEDLKIAKHCVCADQSGPKAKESQRVLGGAQHYFR